MRGKGRPHPALLPIAALIFFGCGHSRAEWEQKVRENEELKRKLLTSETERRKAESDYADTLEAIESLRTELSERGHSISSMTASLEAQNKALHEYQERTAQLLEIQERFDALRKKLQKWTKMGLSVVVRDNRLVIQLPGDVLFDSGSDKLKEEGQSILLEIAGAIRTDADLASREFQVAGHTDSFVLSGGYFRDNWGLSAMRARSVLALLTAPERDGGGGLDETHWSAAGYGSTDPVAENDSAEGRARNRRVELVVQPDVTEMINLDALDTEAHPKGAEP